MGRRQSSSGLRRRTVSLRAPQRGTPASFTWTGPRLHPEPGQQDVGRQRRRARPSWHLSTRANRRHEAPGKGGRGEAAHTGSSPAWRRFLPLPGRPEARRRAPRSEPAGPLAVVVSVLEMFLGAVVLAVISAVSLVPAATGWVPLTVLTGSMEPRIPPGSLIVVRSVTAQEANQLQAGQVATYLPEAGSDLLVTHRIVRVRALDDGTVHYEFKGDANSTPDPLWVRPVQVRGVLQYHVPFLGRVLTLLKPSTKETWRTLAALGLALYALWEGAGALVQWRREKRKAQQRAQEGVRPGPGSVPVLGTTASQQREDTDAAARPAAEPGGEAQTVPVPGTADAPAPQRAEPRGGETREEPVDSPAAATLAQDDPAGDLDEAEPEPDAEPARSGTGPGSGGAGVAANGVAGTTGLKASSGWWQSVRLS